MSRPPAPTLRLLAMVLAVLAVAPSALAQEDQDIDELIDEEVARRRMVERWIQNADVLELAERWYEVKSWLKAEAALDVGLTNTLMYQRSTGGRRPRETSVNNFVAFGRWQPFGPEGGYGGFSFERRDTLSNATVIEFSRQIGAGYLTNDLGIASRDRTALRQLWWKQPFADGRVALSIGKLNPSTYYDRNRFAGSTSTSFLSQPFATNAARRFPGDGLGLNVTWTISDLVEVTGGVQDANGNNERSGFNTLDGSELFYAAGVRFTPTFDGLGEGNYRVLGWHFQETSRLDDASGVLVSCDQELGDVLGGFLRYGYSDRDAGRLEHQLSGGVVWRDPLGIDNGDLAGLGLAWSRSVNADDGDVSTELFYRAQVTQSTQITPSVLVVFDPEHSDKADPVAVFGIRLRVLF